MSQPGIDLTSELLRGMRLSGVNYRRIETARPFGVGFSAVAGKAQFHFISRGPVLLRDWRPIVPLPGPDTESPGHKHARIRRILDGVLPT